MTDLEIENSIKMDNMIEVAKKVDIDSKNLELYGNDKAKINIFNEYNEFYTATPFNNDINRNIKDYPKYKGNLILVTSINPTPYGEGKTTVSIGINDALRLLNKNSVAVLREPSLGPVFGIKGGATGGGYAQISPSIDINLHFTGDFHALTSANNLIASVIDNHIYQGNTLDIKDVTFKRCLDVNDRALRNITINTKNCEREEKFDITAASELMAILCLATSTDDLKRRISNITVGYNSNNMPVTVKELGCTDAVMILLKDAIKPNLVQSLEHNPIIIHGGPFANIAHGCSSIMSIKYALNKADYVITEAGFGADLGAEKFLDIVSPIAQIFPDCIVVNFTLRALKHNGYAPKEEINTESIEYIDKGICNLYRHIENMQNYTNNIVICLNKFTTDTTKEISHVKELIKDKYNLDVMVCDSYSNGGKGSIDLANLITKVCENKNANKIEKPLITNASNIKEAITNIIDKTYHTKDINWVTDIDSKYPKDITFLPCIAKTQYSISDNPKLLGSPENYTFTINKVEYRTGAELAVVHAGSINTMPGLNKDPNLLHMKYDNGKIEGVK